MANLAAHSCGRHRGYECPSVRVAFTLLGPVAEPNQGRMYLPMSGWTWNSRKALTKMVSAKNRM